MMWNLFFNDIKYAAINIDNHLDELLDVSKDDRNLEPSPHSTSTFGYTFSNVISSALYLKAELNNYCNTFFWNRLNVFHFFNQEPLSQTSNQTELYGIIE